MEAGCHLLHHYPLDDWPYNEAVKIQSMTEKGLPFYAHDSVPPVVVTGSTDAVQLH